MVCKNCGKEIDTGIDGEAFVTIAVTHHHNPFVDDDEASHAFAVCWECFNDDENAEWIHYI